MFTRAVSAIYLLSSVWVCHTIFSSPKRDDTISVVLLSITIAAIIAQEIFTTRKQPYTRPSASSGLIDGTILAPLLLASFKPIIENDFSTKILSDLFCISSLNSVHLLFTFSGWVERSPIRIYATITVGLIFSIYVSLFSDSIPAFLISLVLYLTTHKALLSKIKNTFTVGEASIVANSISLLAYFIWIISFEREKFDLQSYYFQHNVIVLALIGGTILICMITIPFLQYSKNPSSDISSKGTSYSVYFYVATVGTIFGIVAPWVMYIIGSHPVIWIYEDLRHINNYVLFAYWIICLVFLLPVIGWVQRTGVKNIVVRKCFHLLGLVMFVPATWLSPRFLSLGYAVAFAALLILELIKFGNVPPFGPGLTKFMGTFIDTRDTGYFTVTHMYLLVGCAAPLWLVSTLGWDNTSVSSFLPVYAGLLTLGVGDSAAAVIGTFYGRSKWPWPAGSSRSFEGSAANVISVLFSIVFLSLVLLNQNELNWIGIFVAVTLSACLEAITDQIDNITLPILFVALLNSSSGLHK